MIVDHSRAVSDRRRLVVAEFSACWAYLFLSFRGGGTRCTRVWSCSRREPGENAGETSNEPKYIYIKKKNTIEEK